MTRAQLVAAGVDYLVIADEAFRSIVEQSAAPVFPRAKPARQHYAHLVESIIFQQLAGKAAATIHGRFLALFDGPVSPPAVLALSPDQLRAAGLSAAKAASVRDLSQKLLDGTVQLTHMARLSDADVVSELISVRGIGPWTAEMFLMFELGRLDVWPTGDLAVRTGFQLIHQLAEPPTSKALLELGTVYQPYRSIAAWYCWQAVDK